MSTGLSEIRISRWIAAVGFGAITCFTAEAASAADCPGHPDALGTSRTLVVDPREHPRIGTMQYLETLPLDDHEVVLTFDDGPLPRYSNQILEILASQCVKATFFTIGHMAQSSPEGVRKLRQAGHTIGTHTEDHPLTMNHMSLERAKQEIDDGIASVRAALGDDADTALAPFFRIPGLLRGDNVEEYLASQGIQIWSADFLADDWRHISASRVYELAIKRLETYGKGILLLHDIHARTVAALPRILEALKAGGYHVVQVVPATAERPPTPSEPAEWLMHPPPAAIAHWPQIPNFVFADLGSLPAPARTDFDEAKEIVVLNEVSLPRPSWPQPPELASGDAVTLAAPEPSLFEIQGGLDIALRGAALSHRAQRLASTVNEASPKRMSRHETRRLANGRRSRLAHASSHTHRADFSRQKTPSARATHRGSVKRLVQVRKRHV